MGKSVTYLGGEAHTYIKINMYLYIYHFQLRKKNVCVWLISIKKNCLMSLKSKEKQNKL